jgi:hypothetical protein
MDFWRIHLVDDGRREPVRILGSDGKPVIPWDSEQTPFAGMAPVVSTFAVHALIVFGMVMGVTGVGAGVGVLAETPARKAAASSKA